MFVQDFLRGCFLLVWQVVPEDVLVESKAPVYPGVCLYLECLESR